MKLTNQVEEAIALHDAAVGRMDDQDAKIQALPDDTNEEVRELEAAIFERLEADAKSCAERVKRLKAIQTARESIPVQNDTDDTPDSKPAGSLKVKEPFTYRADAEHSYFADLVKSKISNDVHARDRLDKHAREMYAETRDVSTADPGAGVFVPPKYLGELWAELPRESRPFANAIRSMPLPDTGMNVTIPRLTTGASVAVQQTEADAPSETDVDGTLLTVPVRTIAGQNDVSIQALERTFPGMDVVIFQDLKAAYDSYLDTQLLSGTGSNAQHLGIRAVTGRNTVTYTDSTPTNGELLGKIYDAVQQVADGRKANPDLIVMHPRRAAWMAAGLSSTFPLFQQGQLMQAAGQQNGGFLQTLAGLEVVIDSNIGILYGSGTNEDEVYVVRSSDLILMEGPIRTRALEQTLGGNLQVKLQVFAYSAFISGRQPEAIGHISGTGLSTPSF